MLTANSLVATFNHTAIHSAPFEFGEFHFIGKTIPAIVSGVIQSTGTISTSPLSLEAWVAYGVKVEIYRTSTDGFEGATLIGGASAVSEGCASTVPNGLEAAEPCRNVFSNDVPVSIPVLLTEGYNYFIVTTVSFDAQGPGASGYSTEYFANISEDIFNPDLDQELRGISTLAKDFIVSVADEEVEDVLVSSRASQGSVDALQASVDANQATNQASMSALQNSIDALQNSVSALQASVDANKVSADANQETNQSSFNNLTSLVKLPLGQRKKQ
ncbi:MAG: hypothetical protein V7742_20090 [Halioglobus sp.]